MSPAIAAAGAVAVRKPSARTRARVRYDAAMQVTPGRPDEVPPDEPPGFDPNRDPNTQPPGPEMPPPEPGPEFEPDQQPEFEPTPEY